MILQYLSYKSQLKPKKIKSSLYSLSTLSGVLSEWCPSPQLCAKAHIIKVATLASCWQRMGDLIGSGFKLHTNRGPYLPETYSEGTLTKSCILPSSGKF